MATNKVTINTPEGEEVLIDLTGDTIKPSVVVEGVSFHDASGEQKTGTVQEVTAPGGYGFSNGGLTQVQASGDGVHATAGILRDVLLRQNTTFTMIVPWEAFGDTPASNVMEGSEFTSSSGLKQPGTFTVEEEVNDLKSLTSELLTALDGKAGAGVETCTVSIIDVGGLLTVVSGPFVCYSAYENGRIATEFRFLPFEEDLGNSNLRAVLNNVVKGSQIVFYLVNAVAVSGENIVVGEYDTVAEEDYGYFIFSVTVNADTEITLTGEP